MTTPTPDSELCGLMPHARQHHATVVSQRCLADHTYAVQLDAAELAAELLPGQFFMIRPAGGTDPLLGRPFALYDTIVDSAGKVTGFEFAYHVIGKMTSLMSRWQPGTRVELWGPLGNGFPQFQGGHLLCVGGGIGYTPFLAVARETLAQRQYGESLSRHADQPRRVTLCYGVQSQRFRADLKDFEDLNGVRIQISTDDGTEGRAGFVTSLVAEQLQAAAADRPDGVYCCGPLPMMRAVAELCAAAQVPCWLSLETPMACGFGACFSCVTRVRQPDGEWDYRRTCVEGPVFPAESLMLETVG